MRVYLIGHAPFSDDEKPAIEALIKSCDLYLVLEGDDGDILEGVTIPIGSVIPGYVDT